MPREASDGRKGSILKQGVGPSTEQEVGGMWEFRPPALRGAGKKSSSYLLQHRFFVRLAKNSLGEERASQVERGEPSGRGNRY